MKHIAYKPDLGHVFYVTSQFILCPIGLFDPFFISPEPILLFFN